MSANTEDLKKELNWFREVLNTRIALYFDQNSEEEDIYAHELPELGDSDYGKCMEELNLGFEERLALALALIPHINPRLLDIFFTKNAIFDRPFSEFGGYNHSQHKGFLPTGETLAFLLSGGDFLEEKGNLNQRMKVLQLFAPEHPFTKHRILSLEQGTEGGPPLSGKLELSPDYLFRFTSGKEYRPEFSTQFPARLINTGQEWNDLILPASTQEQIEEIKAWMSWSSKLMSDENGGWGMHKKLRPGYRCLFYGPPGTGKTMTACLLGKETNHHVYRVDLSLVVSKYIGETEKNLAKIFDQAESRQWILFFDEADALFGKRTDIRDAHDRYANQEVSFLLQRIETFDGVVILASNRRENIDEAFTRRFESMIYFPMPGSEERKQIWENGISPQAELAPEIDWEQIGQEYELSGGSIMNVIRYASIRALANGGMIQMEDLMRGVRREYGKEGRVV
jgi:hypothetical protein